MAITEQQAREIQRQWERDSVERDQGQQDAVRSAENGLLQEEGISMAEYRRRRAVIPRLEATPSVPDDEASFREYRLRRQRQRRPDAPERLPATLAEYKSQLEKT